jgi:hypothetical protein
LIVTFVSLSVSENRDFSIGGICVAFFCIVLLLQAPQTSILDDICIFPEGRVLAGRIGEISKYMSSPLNHLLVLKLENKLDPVTVSHKVFET